LAPRPRGGRPRRWPTRRADGRPPAAGATAPRGRPPASAPGAAAPRSGAARGAPPARPFRPAASARTGSRRGDPGSAGRAPRRETAGPRTASLSRSVPVVRGVDVGEALPLLGQLVLGEDRGDWTRLHAGIAVDALGGVDVELLVLVEVGLVLRRVDAVHRTDLDARVVLHADAGLCDHVRHLTSPVVDFPLLLGKVPRGLIFS